MNEQREPMSTCVSAGIRSGAADGLVVSEVTEHVNYNAVKINEIDWEFIKDKIKQIDLNERIQWKGILLGTLIPCVIDAINDVFVGNRFNPIPFILIGTLYAVLDTLKQRVDCLREDSNVANRVHLTDLQNRVDQIDKIDQSESRAHGESAI